MNDASVDTGNFDPGAFSAPMFLEATGSYNCTIHPVMVGTITGQRVVATDTSMPFRANAWQERDRSCRSRLMHNS
jgi:hypothetical protein